MKLWEAVQEAAVDKVHQESRITLGHGAVTTRCGLQLVTPRLGMPSQTTCIRCLELELEDVNHHDAFLADHVTRQIDSLKTTGRLPEESQ